MTEPKPIACSLGASDLRRRLDKIAALGRESLIAGEAGDGTHVLRFRDDEETRRRLAEIVAAEAECCPFLDLEVSEREGELVLTLSAPEDGRALADELAAAFVGGSR
jgi:MerR family transcriptional regulator, copper efflux regulator